LIESAAVTIPASGYLLFSFSSSVPVDVFFILLV
jgi:hypothetical protein